MKKAKITYFLVCLYEKEAKETVVGSAYSVMELAPLMETVEKDSRQVVSSRIVKGATCASAPYKEYKESKFEPRQIEFA